MGDPLVFLWFMGLLLFLLGNGRLADLVKLLTSINLNRPTAPTAAAPAAPKVVNAQDMPNPPIVVTPRNA